MSVLLQDRDISTAPMNRADTHQVVAGVHDDLSHYSSTASKLWFVGVFVLVVSFPLGCFIAIGMMNDMAPGSVSMYACFAATLTAVAILWIASRYERANSRVTARKKQLAK